MAEATSKRLIHKATTLDANNQGRLTRVSYKAVADNSDPCSITLRYQKRWLLASTHWPTAHNHSGEWEEYKRGKK